MRGRVAALGVSALLIAVAATSNAASVGHGASPCVMGGSGDAAYEADCVRRVIYEGKALNARAFRAPWPITPGYFTTIGSPDRRTVMAFDTAEQLDA